MSVIALLAAAVAAAQPPSGDVVIGRREIVDSATLNEDRPILVSLPPPGPPGTLRFGAGALPGDDPARRRVELRAYGRRRAVPRRERPRPADGFLAFLADELLPHVDRTYPTLPCRVLVGHSNAGMFSLYALMRRPGVFSAHFVMSPSFGQDDRFVAALDRFLASRERLDAFVYVSAGDEEADVSVGAIRFAKALEAGAPSGLEWRYEYFKGESHGSVAHKAVYRGLELLGFADGAPPTAAAAFLPKTELRRRAWVRRFGSDFGTPPMARASIAGPLLRVLAESGSAQLGAQYVFLRSTEPDSFRFDAVELEKLETWLASQGRAKDSEAVRALRGSPTASRSPHLPASPAEAP